MEKPASPLHPDLQRFIEKFEPRKFKYMPKGIEIRGINEIYVNITQAKALIARLDLRLTVSHNAQMVSYGAFEVNTL